MSKPEDPTQIAQAPDTTIKQTKDPVPMGTPPPPYEPGQGLGPALVSNQEKLSVSTSLSTVMQDTRKELSEAMKKEGGLFKNETGKLTDPASITNEPKMTWAEQVAGTKKAYNDDNNQSKGKSLYEMKAASTSMPGEKTEAPKMEKKPSFVERYQQEKTPPPTKPQTKGPTK